MWYSHLLLPKKRIFTKALSVLLMISLSIDLVLLMRVCLCNENDGNVEKSERYS